jgi:uncharacterized membrane protein YccF (DUF307 family)
MNLIGNLIWLIFGGLFSAIGYWFGGLVLCLTIIGIPFGLQCFKLASFALWPFGRAAVNTSSATGCLPLIMNVIWILGGGLATAFVHISMGIFLCIMIIGIPFGRQHFKMIEVALMPFGKKIVDKTSI